MLSFQGLALFLMLKLNKKCNAELQIGTKKMLPYGIKNTNRHENLTALYHNWETQTDRKVILPGEVISGPIVVTGVPLNVILVAADVGVPGPEKMHINKRLRVCMYQILVS